ncbi:MAG: radical SAM protein [Clostridiales bacterium]|jgi:hypothetical protein|nr:radical SAM protein [Clostridiales bacterium]
MATLKEKLYDELKLKLALSVEGVNYEHGIFDSVLEEDPMLKKFDYCTWDKQLVTTKQYSVPSSIVLEHGFDVGVVVDRDSPYKIEKASDKDFVVTRNGQLLSNISFLPSPKFYSKMTSDGTPMRVVGSSLSGLSPDKSVIFGYSTECAVKDNDETCLFCVMNGTKGLDAPETRPPWKTSAQISETAKAAYDEGYSHLTITGGFIPERREVEYYLDVAESIQLALGVEDFNGQACIGAPMDLSVIDRYKEAGFSSIGLNTEVWRKEYFDIVCPGKVRMCGGYDNWIKALEHAVKVFGRGKVRSCFVAGLQPKDVLFEGLEYLASIGVITIASSWVPGIGSPLEGHRSPTVDWHWDVQLRHANLLRKNGFTYKEIFDATPGRGFAHEIYQIEDETLPIFSAIQDEG